MNVDLENPPMKKFFNYSLIKPVRIIQKETGRVTSFGLIGFSAEQSSQMLEQGFSNYYVTTSYPSTNSTKYLIRTQ